MQSRRPGTTGLEFGPEFASSIYILTLGVVKEFRRNGIATILLDNLINHLTRNPVTSDCKALYLHVLTTNIVAIRFYENRQFKRHLFLPLYYSINSTARDGFSYVLYINGGRPELTLLYPFLMPTTFPLIISLTISLTAIFTDYFSAFYQLLGRMARVNPCKWTKRAFQLIASSVCRLIPLYSTHKPSSPHLATC